jgi:hypothetical protein
MPARPVIGLTLSRMLRRRQSILIGSVLATLCVTSLFCIGSFRDRVGRSAIAKDAGVRDLPPDATDIRWFLPGAFGPNVLYDFAAPEASFER